MKTYKVLLVFCLGLFNPVSIQGQLKLGGNPHEIHPYALLEMDSNTMGLLLPRMTTQQRNQAFSFPLPPGLLIFNEDTQQIDVVISENQWQPIPSTSNVTVPVLWEDFKLKIGSAPAVDLSSLKPSPPQLLSLSNHRLSLENGGRVDLSSYVDPPQQLSLQSNTLILERGGQVVLPNPSVAPQTLSLANDILVLDRGGQVDLSRYVDSPQRLSIEGNVLFLEQGGQVVLPSTTVDSQTLSLENDILILQQGGAVDLSRYNTPPQQLDLQDTTLSITNGGSVDLRPLFPVQETTATPQLSWSPVDEQTTQLQMNNESAVTLQVSGNLTFSYPTSTTLVIESTQTSITTATPFRTIDGVTRNASGTLAMDHFLFGSETMDNQTGADDNARFFFHKEKAAFRAGYASGSGWNESNLGDYTWAANYRTEAKGHRSVALGNSTIAESFSETVMGSYNTLSEVKDKEDWVPNTRLLTLGNGQSASERSNALVVLKNGNFGFNTDQFGEGATHVLALGAGTPPTSNTASSVQLYVRNDTGRFELFVMDSGGNETQLSPHRFELMEASDPMAWSFYSQNKAQDRIINVDMLAALRELEKVVGKPLVFLADGRGNPIKNEVKTPSVAEEIAELKARIRMLEEKLLALLPNANK